MARKDWVYIPFDKPFLESVDKAVDTVYSHGTAKYQGRKDFIVKAIQKQLDEEIKMEVTA